MSLMGAADNERARADRLAPGSMISILLEQHAKIRDTFAAVQLAEGARRRELFDELRELLAVHEAGEETVLRPVSRKSAGDRTVDARNREEDEAAHLLAELEQMDVAGEQFAGKLAELDKAVSEHADREELEEFTAVQGAQTDEEVQLDGGAAAQGAEQSAHAPAPRRCGLAGRAACRRTVRRARGQGPGRAQGLNRQTSPGPTPRDAA